MRTKQIKPQDDPVVKEVREARAKLWNEGGGTIEGFLRAVRKRAATRRRCAKAGLGRSSARRRKK